MLSTIQLGVLLAVLLQVIFVECCPSKHWHECGEKAVCIIPHHIKRGFLATPDIEGGLFWRMDPFSGSITTGNSDSDPNEEIVLGCEYAHLTPLGPCCYYEMDHEFSDDYKGSISYSMRGDNYFDFSAMDTNPIGFRVNVGSLTGGNGPYVYRVAQGNKAYCNGGQFPASIAFDQYDQTCNYGTSMSTKLRIPIALNHTTWTLCSGALGRCEGLNPAAAYWIKMGSTFTESHGDQFYFQLVIAIEGKIECDPYLFDFLDLYPPTEERYSYCFISEPVFSFANKIGDWRKIVHCQGCGVKEYKVTTGISAETSSTITDTDEWKSALTKSLEAGIKLGPFSAKAGISLTTEQSQSVTNSMTNVIQRSEERETDTTCDHDGLWQWITAADQNTFTSGVETLTIESTEYFCGDQQPKCAPGFCINDACQKCTYDSEETLPHAIPAIINRMQMNHL